MKTCTKCLTPKDSANFYGNKRMKDGLNSWCKKCMLSQQRNSIASQASRKKYRNSDQYKKVLQNYKDSGRAQRAYHNSHLKRKYGITLEDKEKLYFLQKGNCALCGEPLPNVFKSCLDHNHTTGQVRGLLHAVCNVMVGLTEKDREFPLKTLSYLKQFEGEPPSLPR